MKNYRSSNGKAGVLLNLLSDPALIVDEKGDFLNVNSAFEEVTGLSRKELIGSHFSKLNILTAEMKVALLEIVKKRIRDEPNEPYEVCFTGKAGETRYVEVKERKIRYAGQSAYLNVLRDVTDRKKKADEQISFSEEKYKNLFENAPDVIVTFDLTGKITSVNKAIIQHGFKENEILGSDIFKLVPIEYHQKILTGLKNIAAGNPAQGEIEIFTPKGKRSAEYNGNPIWLNGKVVACQTIIRDVTARKKTEEALLESEKKARTIVANAPIGIATSDVNKHFLSANEAFCRIIGYSEDELRKLTFKDITYREDFEESAIKIAELENGSVPSFTLEKRYVKKDGAMIDGKIVVSTVRDENGKLILFIAELEDITERKRMTLRLVDSEKRYHALFDQAPLGVLVIDPETAKPVEFNDVAHTQLGYSKEEFSKLRISDFEVKETPNEINAHLAKIMLEGGDEFETEQRTKNGEIRNVLVNTKVVELDGKTFLYCVFRDTTEIRKVQKALMDSEAGYRQLVELAQEGIWAVDNNFNTVFVNPHMAQMLGYTESEMIGKSIFDFLIKAEVEKTTQYLSQFKQGVKGNFEYELTRKDGSHLNTSIAAVQIKDDEGSYLGTLALVSDITMRKRMENELRQETEKLETITEGIGAGLTIISKDYRILWTNKVMKQLRGIPDLEGRTCYATYNSLDTICPECGVKKVFEGKESDSREYMVFDRQKGSTVWMQLIATPIKDKDGNVTSALELVLPITERKKVESLLKSSEENFRNLAEQSPNMIFIHQKGKIVYVNTEVEEVTGIKKEEFYSPTFNYMDLIAPESKELVKSIFIKHKKGEGVRPYEFKFISKKGQTIDVINNTKVIIYNGEPAILGIETDITENKRLKEKLEQYSLHLEDLVKKRTLQLEQAQAQLVKSERLAAIGELAGMVGHDLRNPLTGIKNAAYYLKKKGPECPENQFKEMFEIIDKAIDHSNKIINDLLDYAREMHLELTESSLPTLLSEAVRMIQVPDRIQILNHVYEEATVKVDADKMMRVFINLIKNAVEAMPQKGTLEIASRKTRDNVEIAFADTGTGIPKETLPQLFTPLFTTKAQGMGFGLAICKRIIEAHGGRISVKTAVNKGTTFKITLPIKPKLEIRGEKTCINMPESLLSTTTKA